MSQDTTDVVWVDLDATLAVYDGWKGIRHIGEPFAGARPFMERLRAMGREHGFRVGVFSVRTKPDMPGREELLAVGVLPEGVPLALSLIVRDWLDGHAIPFDVVYDGHGKPPGICFVDDRGVNCEPAVYGCLAYRIAESLVERMVAIHHKGGAHARAGAGAAERPGSGPGASRGVPHQQQH